MPLHLLKLSVGAESIGDHQAWIKERLAARKAQGKSPVHLHRTRMVPKRVDELVDGGSMYWVIKGQVSARQSILAVKPFTGDDGIARCHIVMKPKLIAVMPRPFRPFQGWRYLLDQDAPADLKPGQDSVAAMPETLRRELRDLGLI